MTDLTKNTPISLIATTGLILVLTAKPGASQDSPEISPFAANVTRHVLLHELGHAVMREFKLPILTNEESMADSFATILLTQMRRDDALEIATARIKSWMIEDKEVSPEDYDMKGEHDLDIRRAYQTACLLYGSDPAEWGDDLAWIEFSERDAADCSDAAPDQIDAWIKVLNPHFLDDGRQSDTVEVIFGDGPMKAPMQASGLMDEIAEIARNFDWPNPITFHFDHCDSGASWSRSKRRILLCDAYVQRFISQGKILASN